jgi:hypothetical protein
MMPKGPSQFGRLEGDLRGELRLALIAQVIPDRNPAVPAYRLGIELLPDREKGTLKVPLTGKYEVAELLNRRLLVIVQRKKTGRIESIEPLYSLAESGPSLIVES